MKQALRIKINKNGRKRIKIGNFIINFDNTCITGHEHLTILKDTRDLEIMRAIGADERKPISDWMISIWETDKK